MQIHNEVLASEQEVNQNKQPVEFGEYVIGLGDQLQIMVWKEPELSHSTFVRIDGRISLPLVGDVFAAGKTIKVFRGELEGLLSQVVAEPAVSVMLLQSKSWRYYILGQIKQPGEFPIDYPITLLQAIARSGGFMEWAKKDEIIIIRRTDDKDTIVKFNYDSLVKGENLAQNIILQPGDTIIVP
nr:polysaccharide biosynthesis/export family protein [Desulfobulbaceae bacterium]